MMTREKHLQWCKLRALGYVDAGDCKNAYASMISDLNKHPETRNHPAAKLGMMLIMTGNMDNPQEMRRFIEGFN
jgi:hypothetical protein